ncbi:MAG TPA: CAAX prenyl protease-related protein [Bryobacteraceae bacterium]|nr:CAAX prenyl protease-related protein [Bryobacteraceae bacterium]
MTRSPGNPPAISGKNETAETVRYVAPFVLFLILLTLAPFVPLPPLGEAVFRFVLLAVACIICWPREVPLAPRNPWASIALGIAVFVLWILPDLLVRGYRELPLFSNPIVGHLHSSLSPNALSRPSVLGWRTARAVLIVPVVEELFWRGWLMRWLIDKRFREVKLGTYAPFAFWFTAILFAAEHGPYWDVGLLTGVLYNWWMLRTKSIADCILAHAVTNAALCWYIIAAKQWQYWQ